MSYPERCPKCGAEQPDVILLTKCSSCGYPFNEPAETPGSHKDGKKPRPRERKDQ